MLWLSLHLSLCSAQSASPMDLDLRRFASKLMRDHPAFFGDKGVAERAISEYRKFLRLHQRLPEHQVASSKLVDLVWHEHILYTRAYMRDSQALFGRYLHHYPCFDGEVRPFDYSEDMNREYLRVFGEEPPPTIWSDQAVANASNSSAPPPCPPPPCAALTTEKACDAAPTCRWAFWQVHTLAAAAAAPSGVSYV
jgi:hypothetical protein